MRRPRRLRSCCLGVFLAWCVLLSAASVLAAGPAALVKNLADRCLAVVEDEKLDEAVKYARLRAIVEPHVDFKFMSQLVLGRHWPRHEAREPEFTPLFKKLLERTYFKQVWLKEGRGARVEYPGEKIEGRTARVETKVITAKGEEHPVGYRLHLASAKWKIYDVLVLGMSLVSNYRSRFDKFLAKRTDDPQAFDQLLAHLRKEIESAEDQR